MHFTFYKQYDGIDCGPTCQRMVAKYFKKDISLQYLRDQTQLGKEGVNLLGISEAAETIIKGCLERLRWPLFYSSFYYFI